MATSQHSTRIEKDSLGEVAVPADRLWGAQTQRSLENFGISTERVPLTVIHALAAIKKAAALTNAELDLLPQDTAEAIARAADEVTDGLLDAEFPLSVWQTGSGTQTHMNVNEVLANRASELLGAGRGEQRVVHPNDHVNLGQSSNDVFSSAVNLSAALALCTQVAPSVSHLAHTIDEKARQYADVIKLGRTHLQDATPLTVGNELSGWSAQLEHCLNHLQAAQPHLLELALGGTAVGTGLNTHPDFAARAIARLAERFGLELRASPNRFEAMSAHDAIVFAHGSLKTLAGALIKIANDVRWLASGPRCGLGELSLPANEPGSSIMPGKVNPTQCEAVLMCAMQVMGNDVAINHAGSSGNFQLNVAKPLLAHAFQQSCRLLADASRSFADRAIAGLSVNRERLAELVEQSLMLVTALSPHIGYDTAAAIAKLAHERKLTLREAAVVHAGVSEDDFDRWVRPEKMLAPQA